MKEKRKNAVTGAPIFEMCKGVLAAREQNLHLACTPTSLGFLLKDYGNKNRIHNVFELPLADNMMLFCFSWR